MKKRRNFTAKFKAEVVLEELTGVKSECINWKYMLKNVMDAEIV